MHLSSISDAVREMDDLFADAISRTDGWIFVLLLLDFSTQLLVMSNSSWQEMTASLITNNMQDKFGLSTKFTPNTVHIKLQEMH